MAASNLYMNVTGVTTTLLPGSSAVTWNEITEAKIDKTGDVKNWLADAAVGPIAKAVKNQERKLSLSCGALNTASALVLGSSYTVVFIINDFANGTGSGAITFTLTPAVCVNDGAGGRNNEFSVGEIAFEGLWGAAGTVDPLTAAIAA